MAISGSNTQLNPITARADMPLPQAANDNVADMSPHAQHQQKRLAYKNRLVIAHKLFMGGACVVLGAAVTGSTLAGPLLSPLFLGAALGMSAVMRVAAQATADAQHEAVQAGRVPRKAGFLSQSFMNVVALEQVIANNRLLPTQRPAHGLKAATAFSAVCGVGLGVVAGGVWAVAGWLCLEGAGLGLRRLRRVYNPPRVYGPQKAPRPWR